MGGRRWRGRWLEGCASGLMIHSMQFLWCALTLGVYSCLAHTYLMWIDGAGTTVDVNLELVYMYVVRKSRRRKYFRVPAARELAGQRGSRNDVLLLTIETVWAQSSIRRRANTVFIGFDRGTLCAFTRNMGHRTACSTYRFFSKGCWKIQNTRIV